MHGISNMFDIFLARVVFPDADVPIIEILCIDLYSLLHVKDAAVVGSIMALVSGTKDRQIQYALKWVRDNMTHQFTIPYLFEIH